MQIFRKPFYRDDKVGWALTAVLVTGLFSYAGQIREALLFFVPSLVLFFVADILVGFIADAQFYQNYLNESPFSRRCEGNWKAKWLKVALYLGSLGVVIISLNFV